MSPRDRGDRSAADLVVVGGGPVGLAAATSAALRGLDVVVVEPRPGPVDKACGEGLMPGAVAALAELGVRPVGRPFTGISYVAADGSAGGRHAFAAGPGLGVRRTTLHEAVDARAREVGVRVVGDRVVALAQDGAGVAVGLAGGGSLRAPWVLACDGLHSPTRALLGVRARSDGRRYGLRRHARVAPWSTDVEVHWSADAEAYVTPVGPREVGVAVLARAGRDPRRLLDGFPVLADRLAGAAWSSPARGAGPLLQRVDRRVAGRVLLVGDAGGYVDALTGEGLRVGLAGARAAVDAVLAGDPARYEAAWWRLTREYRRLTWALVTATRLAPVRSALPWAAGRVPAVMGRAVEALAG
ncbi:NAD(P)/FAD-dependent oxidoreductase [Thalassiella azotivora]